MTAFGRRKQVNQWRQAGLCVHCGRIRDGKQLRCQRCRDYFSRASRKRIQRNKLAAFNAYGGPICVCCGEERMFCLTIEHSFGNGADHRRELKIGRGGSNFYGWLKKQNYPQDLGLEVLCFNCQAGREFNKGTCPHVEEVEING